jgi:alpha-L-rhamnosidase
MNSLNHYAYGSVCQAIYSRIAGLKNLSPGWKKVLIQPHLNYRMRKINLEYNSISGKFEISWYFDDSKFYMNAIIPNGVEAEIILPDGTDLKNIGKGMHHYDCEVSENIYSPFTIDTPLFEIVKSEEAKNLLAVKVPTIYYMMMGENEEMMYGSLRLLSDQPFVGIPEPLLKEIDIALRKIRVSPSEEDDELSDEPIDKPTDKPNDEPIDSSRKHTGISGFIKLNLFIFILILLF